MLRVAFAQVNLKERNTLQLCVVLGGVPRYLNATNQRPQMRKTPADCTTMADLRQQIDRIELRTGRAVR